MQSDVWALGCCLYEMATLKHAFNARDFNSLGCKILRGKVQWIMFARPLYMYNILWSIVTRYAPFMFVLKNTYVYTITL